MSESPDRRFWFRLALSMHCSLKECQQRVDSPEFSEWKAFYELEPFGPDRQDVGHAITATVIANAHRSSGGRPFEVSDFIPRWEPKRPATPDELLAKFQVFAKQHESRGV